MDTKYHPNKEKKAKIVAEISERVAKSKALVFTNYQGLTHKQIEEFKKSLRKLEAEYAVTKNTFLVRALQNSNLQTPLSELNQPTATLFLYGDPIAPLKALTKMLKDFQKPSIKFGIMEGQLLDEKQVIKFASLPPREILLSQLIGMLQIPIYGLHRSLNWNLQKFALTLKAIENKKKSTT